MAAKRAADLPQVPHPVQAAPAAEAVAAATDAMVGIDRPIVAIRPEFLIANARLRLSLTPYAATT